MKYPLILFVLLVLTSSCKPKERTVGNVGYFSLGYVSDYTVNQPDMAFTLPSQLKEISGLTYSIANKQLLAVNDEKGKLFAINESTGNINDRLSFGKKGDYEGLAYNNGLIYVISSNGRISILDELRSETKSIKITNLSDRNNIEGLSISGNKLLIAAKGNSKLNGNDARVKSIFSYGLESSSIIDSLTWHIDAQSIIETMEERGFSSGNITIGNSLERLARFAPSGIAIHPSSDEVYILSARGKLLMIFDKSKNAKAVIFLNDTFHKQPEGICFSPDGSLFISNEGKMGAGMIYKYSTN